MQLYNQWHQTQHHSFNHKSHNNSTIYKFEQNQLAATPFANPKPTNINTATNKIGEIKSKWKEEKRRVKEKGEKNGGLEIREKKKDGGVQKKRKMQRRGDKGEKEKKK